MVLAAVAALLSALFLAIASVLQHRAGYGRTLLATLRRPVWVVGALAGLAGFAFHVAALSEGALTIVQPILVTSLLFALPLSLGLQRRTIRVREACAAAAVVGGLIAFQVTAHPAAGTELAATTRLAWCTAVAVAVTGAGLLLARADRARRAEWLGFCAGAGYGLVAALLKDVVGTATEHGLAAVTTTWPFYAFLVLTPVAIAVNQLAFNAGPLARSLPLMTVVDPLFSVIIGAVAFGETVSTTAAGLVGQVAAFAVMALGVSVLSAGEMTPAPATTPPPELALPLVRTA